MNIFIIFIIVYYVLGLMSIIYLLCKLKYNLENSINYKII